MALIVEKGNAYVPQQAFQVKEEDFSSLVVPYSVGGMIVDVVNRRMFRGRIYVDIYGKIEKIEEREDVSETTYIVPGLIDSHVHIESSMSMPSEFACAAVKHGVVGCVCDPHEIANVLGIPGLRYFMDNAKASLFKFFFGAPSCVPSTNLETSGAILGPKEIKELMADKDIFFLGEMMNFPGVISHDSEVYAKLQAALDANKPIDGHAPGVNGNNLRIYAKAGISTDHECMDLVEAEEKLQLGMKILIREGSAAKNFETLYTLIDKYPDQVMLCTDDAHPDDLLDGYINGLVKRGLEKGVDLFNLLQAACLNPIKHYSLPVGLLQEGDSADFVVVDSLNKNFEVLQTYIEGKIVYDRGEVLLQRPTYEVKNNFQANPIQLNDLKVEGNFDRINTIGVINKELYTKHLIEKARVENNELVSDPENDLLKIVVLNRYTQNAKPVIGFIKGFGLKQGAICSTVAHDSHNIIAIGTNDVDLQRAINVVIKSKGGISVSNNSSVNILELPIAGIISNRPIEETAASYKRMDLLAKELGTTLTAPFMTLAFMALIVIPELKLCDKGLFNVKEFQFIDLKA